MATDKNDRPQAHDDILQGLRGLDFPPTQMESLEKLLTMTRTEDPQQLGDLVRRQRVTENRFRKAEQAWLTSCQGIANHIQASLEKAGQQLEEELFRELIGEKERA
jgi:hypothetical protein